MGFLKSFVLVAVLCVGCTDGGINTQTLSSDTSMRSIDSSKMINNTSRLPADSTTVTVTQ